MSEIIYEIARNTQIEAILMDDIKAELYGFFKTNRALLDSTLNAEEQYTYDSKLFKVLTKDSKPIRRIECVNLLVKNDIVVGQVLLRVTNNKPKHSDLMQMDVLERTYELRFKTYSGCDFTVEGTGISIVQTGNGPLIYGTSSLTPFHEKLLKRHWDEFKAKCTFATDDINNPIRKEVYTPLKEWKQGPEK